VVDDMAEMKSCANLLFQKWASNFGPILIQKWATILYTVQQNLTNKMYFSTHFQNYNINFHKIQDNMQ